MNPSSRRLSGHRDHSSLGPGRGPGGPSAPDHGQPRRAGASQLGALAGWFLLVATGVGSRADDNQREGCADPAARVANTTPPVETSTPVFILPGQLGRDAEIDRGRLGDSFPPSPAPGFPGSPR